MAAIPSSSSSLMLLGAYFIWSCVVGVDLSLCARINKGEDVVCGKGGEGRLLPTELDRSRFEDNVLERNEGCCIGCDNLRPMNMYLYKI